MDSAERGSRWYTESVRTLCPTVLFRFKMAKEYYPKFDYLATNKEQVRTRTNGVLKLQI